MTSPSRLHLAPDAFAVAVCGPSGVGKSTICQKLTEADPSVRACVTTTTRPMRAGEVDGEHRHFETEEGFQGLVDGGEMVEWAEVHGYRYGSTVDAVNQAMRAGQVMLLDIDVQGADTWKRVLGDQYIRVFILPPSVDELSRRLADRKTEAPESFELRMKTARLELEQAPHFDYALVNQDLNEVLEELKAVLLAERRRPHRLGDLPLSLIRQAAESQS